MLTVSNGRSGLPSYNENVYKIVIFNLGEVILHEDVERCIEYDAGWHVVGRMWSEFFRQ